MPVASSNWLASSSISTSSPSSCDVSKARRATSRCSRTGGSCTSKHVRPARLDFPDVAAHYAISSLFRSYPARASIYCYDVEREDHPVFEAGSPTISTGLLRLRSRITTESALVMFGMLYLGDVKLSCGAKVIHDRADYERLKADMSDPAVRTDFAAGVRLLDRHFESLTFSIRSLFRDEQRQILGYIWNSALAEAEAAFRSLHDRYVPLLRLHGDLSVPVPKVLSAAAEADLIPAAPALARALLLVAAFSWPYWSSPRQPALIRESRVYILDNTLSHQVGGGTVQARDEIVRQLQRTGMVAFLGEENIFPATRMIGESGNSGLRAAREWLGQDIPEGNKSEAVDRPLESL